MLCASGTHRASWASALGLSEPGVRSAIRRLLTRVDAHCMDDVLKTILRDAD